MADFTAATQPNNAAASSSTKSQVATPTPPFIAVEGVPNIRDLGGYPTSPPKEQSGHASEASTRSIRADYLFRCAQPSRITSTGIATLTSKLNVRSIYDLRSSKEIRLMATRYPDLPLDIPGVTRHHVPIYKDEDYTPISMARKYNLASSDSEIKSQAKPSRDGFVQAYDDILQQAATSGSFRAIMLHLLERPDEPLAFHCTVGKDRTGVFAAMVLKLCGVHDEAIIWDYALTTQGLGSWRDHLIKRIMDGAGGEYVETKGEDGAEKKRAPTREEAEKIVGSHAEDMQAFLTQVLEPKYGSAGNYFKEMCGFSDRELEKIVSHLVVNKAGYLPPT